MLLIFYAIDFVYLNLATLLKSLTSQYCLYIDFCFYYVKNLQIMSFISSPLILYCTMLNNSRENGYLGFVPKLKGNVLKVEGFVNIIFIWLRKFLLIPSWIKGFIIRC